MSKLAAEATPGAGGAADGGGVGEGDAGGGRRAVVVEVGGIGREVDQDDQVLHIEGSQPVLVVPNSKR